MKASWKTLLAAATLAADGVSEGTARGRDVGGRSLPANMRETCRFRYKRTNL